MKPASPGPLDILNMLGGAAHKKAQQAGQTASPDDEEDPVNSKTPKAKKSPAAPKQVAAIKTQEKKKGPIPGGMPPIGV